MESEDPCKGHPCIEVDSCHILYRRVKPNEGLVFTDGQCRVDSSAWMGGDCPSVDVADARSPEDFRTSEDQGIISIPVQAILEWNELNPRPRVCWHVLPDNDRHAVIVPGKAQGESNTAYQKRKSRIRQRLAQLSTPVVLVAPCPCS